MSNPYPDYKSNVVYTLPEPAWIHEERNLNSSYTIPVFTADQMQAAYQAGAASRDTQHVGATQEIWDAINVDLQQILDDVSCWEGRHAERMCENLETAIKRLNAAVGHEREGYETAIATSYDNDKLRAEIEALHAEIQRQYACISSHAEITQKAEAEVEALRAALDELSHAVHEIHHARHKPNWFTNGKYAAMQHESLWIGRAAEMVNKRSAAIAAEATK